MEEFRNGNRSRHQRTSEKYENASGRRLGRERKGMPLSKEFVAELTHIIKTWVVKEKLDWEKIKHYELKVMCRIVFNGGAIKYCMLCDTTKTITITGMFYDDGVRQIVVYFLCEDCAKEFFDLPEDQRKSIIEKVIEKRIDSTPVVRMCDGDEVS